MPQFSIITACFNRKSTIERTLRSVLNQTFGDYEYIIIDGASTDGTMDIVRSYESRFGGRMRIVSEKDNGIYDALNKGIRMARGDLIGFVHSDDYLEPDALETIAAYRDSSIKYQLLYGMLRTVTPDGETTHINFTSHKLLDEEMIPHPTCYATRELYQDKGVYDLQYVSAADYDFLLRMFHDPEVVFTPIENHILTNFTVGGESSNVRSKYETFKIWRKHGCITTKRYWLITLSTYAKSIIR